MISTSRRLLMIINTCQYGGAERYTVSLARGLTSRGMDIRVACPPDGKLAEILRGSHIPVIPLDLGLKIGRYRGFELYFPRVYSRAPALLRTFLTSLHEEWPYKGVHFQFLMEKFFGTPIVKDLGLPVFWTMHGGLPAWYRWHRRLIDLYKNSGNKTEKIICVSRAAEKFEVDNIGIDPSRTHVVFNGIPQEPFHSAPVKDAETMKRLNISREDFVVGLICQVYRQKGHDDCMEIVENASKKISNLRCLVVGTGPYLKKMKRIVEKKGLSAFFRFTGFRTDIPLITKCCDLVVSLSRSKSEGLPLRLIEAMSAGIPILATDVGGTRELVKEGKTGWILPPGRSFLHARRWIDLAGQKERLKIMGENARELAAERFDEKVMIEETGKIITEYL